MAGIDTGGIDVVAPSLTPDCYNTLPGKPRPAWLDGVFRLKIWFQKSSIWLALTAFS